MQSEPKKRKYRKRKKKPEHRELPVLYKTRMQWATEGRELIVNGKTIRAYSRGKLLDAFARAGIARTRDMLYRWEKDGILPKSPIFLDGMPFYTAGMINAIVLTCVECGIGSRTTNKEYLATRLWEEFNRAVNKELF